MKLSRKDYIIEISKKYSVTSKFTSFVAIERREEGEESESSSDLDVDEILDGEDVDILGYIGWLEDEPDVVKIWPTPSSPCFLRKAEVILPTFSRDKSILLLNCPLDA